MIVGEMVGYGREGRAPTFSILMPVHDPGLQDLERAVASVDRQVWPHVELCVVDDGSRRGEVIHRLEMLGKESWVRLQRNESASGIARATNAALALATGDYVVFLDHDDVLADHALVRVAEELRAFPETDFVYSDHDVIDEGGRRLQSAFKPQWSPELLLAYMYVGHIKVCRTDLARELEGFRDGFDGAADFDFLLRLAEKTDAIRHVPEILYSWRAAANSIARSSDTKPEAFESGRRAVQEALDRRGVAARAEWPVWAQRARLGVFRTRYETAPSPPRVAILIPTRDRLDLVRDCITSIEERTTYPNYEIVVLDNDSTEAETLAYFESVPHRILRVPGDFNFSRIVNQGVDEVDAEFVVLLNNDTIIVTSDWLEEMVGMLETPGVGIVGAKLLYPDGRIQHAGVTMGVHGLTAHAFDGCVDGFAPLEPGYFAHVPRNVSAVTAACLITRRETYLELGGFDEAELGVAWNDTDFCLRAREAGNRVVMNPLAELIHVCSASRGEAKNDREVAVMFDRWGDVIEGDPYYNPNLSRLDTDFRPRTHLDEHGWFHYTREGFRAEPDGTGSDAAHERALPRGVLAELCRQQQAQVRALSGRLVQLERADRIGRWIVSRPVFARMQRSGSAARVWSFLVRVRRSPLGSRVLARLGLIRRP